ncbi:MAG TPA: hypothetical protein VFB80_24925, partial [Pirellulaceae bacterium]|nr:hypothetical protein [Pirellulaceae bacterium]
MLVRLSLALLAVVNFASMADGEPPVVELLKLHTSEAEAYRMCRDAAHQESLELNPKPVFNWTNLVGEHTQYGHLFVWLHRGRPEVIGTIFSTRMSDAAKRKVV